MDLGTDLDKIVSKTNRKSLHFNVTDVVQEKDKGKYNLASVLLQELPE